MKCLEKNQCVHCIDYGMNNSFKVKWIFDGLLIMYVFRGKHVFYGRKRKLWTLSLHNTVCPCGPWLMKPCVEKSFPDVAWMAQGLEISFCSLDSVIDHSSSPLFLPVSTPFMTVHTASANASSVKSEPGVFGWHWLIHTPKKLSPAMGFKLGKEFEKCSVGSSASDFG